MGISIRTVAVALLLVAVFLGVAGATYGIVRSVSDNQPQIIVTGTGRIDDPTAVPGR